MFAPIRTCQIVVFLDHVAAGMITPQLPPHAARSLGCNHIFIGLMISLYNGFQIISGSTTKAWVEVHGRRTVLLLTISFCGIAYVLLGVTSSVFVFLMLRAFIGLFKQTQFLTKTLATNYEKDKKQLSELTDTLNLSSSVGLIVGPLIGGHIMENFPETGFTIIAFTVGALYCINSILVRKLPQKTEKEKDKKKNDSTSIKAKVAEYLSSSFQQSFADFCQVKWNEHWEYFFFKVLLSLCIGFFFCNAALYLKFKHHATSEILGYVTSTNALCDLLFSKSLGRINNLYVDDTDFSMRVYHVFLTFTLCFTGMALSPNIPVFVACTIPFFASFVLGRTVISQQIVSKVNGNQKAVYSNVSHDVSALTGVLTPIIAGVLGQNIGILRIVYVSMLIAGVGAYWSYKKVPEILIRSTDKSKNKSE